MSIILNIKRDERTLTVLRGGANSVDNRENFPEHLRESEKLAI